MTMQELSLIRFIHALNLASAWEQDFIDKQASVARKRKVLTYRGVMDVAI